MWCCRASAVVALALLVAACGFRPLFGNFDDGNASAELAMIEIEPIADRIGQQLHNQLLDRLSPEGRPAEASYKLRIELRESRQGFAVDKAEFATRAAYRLSGTYSLFEPDGQKPIHSGRVTSISSYNILRSDYGTLVAEQDARGRAVEQIASDIRTGLALYFAKRRSDKRAAAP